MTVRLSFSAHEKELMHKMREKLNHSEDLVDLENHFALTMIELFSKVFAGEIEIKHGDVSFDFSSSPYFVVDERLKSIFRFKQIWENSDLPDMVKRFADSVHKRSVHISKNVNKNRAKIDRKKVV